MNNHFGSYVLQPVKSPFPVSDGALLRSGLDSARLYFHQKASYPAAGMVNNNDPRDWCKTSGCNADPQLWLETYDCRPGLTPLEPDNTMGTQHHSFTTQEDGQLVMFSDHEHQVDKSLISLVKSDKVGLHIKDFQGRWVLVDEDLGPQEAIVYPGLALYQATAGYVNPALQRTETANTQSNLFGRCILAFKFMPKSMTSLSCSEMRAAGSMKPLLRRRKSERTKPLPPSKRLWVEAQRVLKERVQDIADKKGIKLSERDLEDLKVDPCANKARAFSANEVTFTELEVEV
ncbi:hypothetical protein DVH24_010815 [Malus domestica]|uniref:Uncharacterized protein n=1 Tax=Malus domestica TaxID=3750 RepID=A0A498JST0_MALDO|nr:hypothetical protein DVH24_010815 [Malus domestica]